ncbi:sel1 repeat family protein [Neorhizobium sp. P12A]|uniref:tetratricopeptide repeat protein n=1 Tax=Neorhizobium sp. P12A TaxID=2268027 RepID=UPI0011ED094E|nr:tetratricopeptide repeat protein [Neorhizobium sp. P12A]KAA0700941.1 sel1 repeat family protein [Neorhizobium sp. P12A]
MSLTPQHRLRPFLVTLAACLTALPLVAAAQQSDPSVVTRPPVENPGTFKNERVEPSNEPNAQPSQGGDKPAASAGANDVKPSEGIGIFDRMGAKLPDLPPEKTYKGPVDDAYGAFQRGYYLTAFQKALPRAQLGDPAAQTLIAELMSQGLGVKRDTKNAAFWYGKAAEGGDASSMFKYALILIEGQDVPRDRKKADEWMKKAADAGQASAEFNWAQSLTADNPGLKGLQLALPYYEKSAAQGIADAEYAVSQLYMSLPDISPEKKSEARIWLLRAANAGYDTAQLDMGVWLINGTGGKPDLEAGFTWMKIAAYRGNVAAQNKLSHLYINAIGTKQDPIAAATWYVISRRAGFKDPELEDFYLGIEDDQQKAAIDAANKFHPAK